ncbi:hypothetical protein EC54115_07297, partial [Escherichia coli 541-15]
MLTQNGVPMSRYRAESARASVRCTGARQGMVRRYYV